MLDNPTALTRTYREFLLDGIVPFWRRHGVDEEYGGVLSCMTETGERISDDKYTWSQARWVWTCSALYNRIEKRPEFLRWAGDAIEYLVHRCDREHPDGGWPFRATREGNALEGATSIFADCFVVYGLAEYCRAVPDPELRALARSVYNRIRARVEEPDFAETAPMKLTPGHRPHSIPMILTETAGELAETLHDPLLEAQAMDYARIVMDRFAPPGRPLLLELLDRDYRELPPPEGTLVTPGHAIESMWFVMHRAMRAGDRALIERAADVIRRHLEAGWDKEYGGIFLDIDARGCAPHLPHWDTKIWWPHTEALYALLLAWRLTGERWCADWYARVHEWSIAHFAMPEAGEWRQRLDRRGDPITTTVALPVKDPFHLPRALILSAQLPEKSR